MRTVPINSGVSIWADIIVLPSNYIFLIFLMTKITKKGEQVDLPIIPL